MYNTASKQQIEAQHVKQMTSCGRIEAMEFPSTPWDKFQMPVTPTTTPNPSDYVNTQNNLGNPQTTVTMRFQQEQKCHCFILCTWLAQMLGCPYGGTSSWICWNHHSNRFCQLPGGFGRFGVVNMSILSELQTGSILRPEAHQGRP